MIAGEPIAVNRWQWLETLSSDCGPTCATTRHVLHAVGLFMNPEGESAWPNKRTLSLRTALSERAITKHISLARSSEWIEVKTRMQPGRGWRVNQYRAIVPAHAAGSIPEIKKHTEPRSVRSARHREPHTATYGTSFHDIPNQVPTNKPVNKPVNNEPPCAKKSTAGPMLATADKAFADLYAKNEGQSKNRTSNGNRGNES